MTDAECGKDYRIQYNTHKDPEATSKERETRTWKLIPPTI